MKRIFHQSIACLAAGWPALSERLVASFSPAESTTIPRCLVSKLLEQCKLALVTTAGIHHKDQHPFDMLDAMGDPTFRVINAGTITGDYKITYDYYDHRDADRDLNIVFPIERLEELHAIGRIGGLSDMHFSFMGHIDGRHVETLVNRTAPRVARILKELQVDAVLLTPALGICHQSVGLIQRTIEAAGIPTVSISINRSFTAKVKPPRSIFLDWPFGHPLGEPSRIGQQSAVLHKAFEALRTIETPGMIIDVDWPWRML